MDRPTARLAEERIGKLLWSFSAPAIAGTVAGSIYIVIDRAFLGHVVGADAIAGISLCMPIGFLMMAFGMLVGVGSGALISIRLGQERNAEAELSLGNAFAVLVIMAVVLTTVFMIALDPLLAAFGASPRTLPYAKQFMQIILIGSAFQHVGFGLNAVIRAEGNPRLAMMTMFINAGINIVLDALFIWELGLGVAGAAVATVIAQASSAVWTLLHFRSARSVLKLRAANLRPRWEVIRPALAIGMAPFAMHVAASVITLLLNRALATHGGDMAIGAFGVIGALVMLILMPIFGITQGAQPIIGFNYGAGRVERVRQTLRLAILAATGVVCAGFVVAEVFPTGLMRAFSGDAQLIETGTRGMRIYLVMLPVVGFQVVGANFFQAIGRARTALVLALLRQVLMVIPMILILPRYFGLDGVWVSSPISDLVSSLLTAAALAHRLRALAPPGAARGAVLPEDAQRTARSQRTA